MREASWRVTAAGAAGLLALALACRLVNVRGAYEVFVDEVTYATIGRNLAAGDGVTLYGDPFFLHPPALFGLEAAALGVFGTPGSTLELVLDLRVLTAVAGTIGCLLLALFVSRVTDRATGLLAGVLLALDPFVIRFDGRVLLEAPAMMFATGGMLCVLALVRRAPAGAEPWTRRPWRLELAAGVLFGLAVLTKDTYAFVTVLPAALLFVACGPALRRTLARVVATAAACYGAYLLAVVASGNADGFVDAKLSGVQRLLGLQQITGFNQAGSVGFVDRLVANVGLYVVTYTLIGLGLLALVVTLATLRRRRIRPAADPAAYVCAAWALAATAHLTYAGLIGTFEEQMFYMLVSAGAPLLFLTGRRVVAGASPRAGVAVAAVLAAAIVINGVVTTTIHAGRDDSYARLVAWSQRGLPADATVALTEDTAQFVLERGRLGQWRSLRSARQQGVDYLVLSTNLVEQGYSDIEPALLAAVRARGRLVFDNRSRTAGRLQVFDTRRVVRGPALRRVVP